MILEDIWVKEVAMNPAAYADSMTQAAERGVLVGFEFEVLVPQEAVARLSKLTQTDDTGQGRSEQDWIDAWLENMYNTPWSEDNEGAPSWWSRVPAETWDRIFKFKKGALAMGNQPAMSIAEAMQLVQARKEDQLRQRFEQLKEKEREKVLKAWNSSRDKQRDDSIRGFARFLLNNSTGVPDVYRMGAYNRMFPLVRAASEASEPQKYLLNYVLMRMVAPVLNAPDYEREDLVDIDLEAAMAATPPEILQRRRRRDRYDEDSEYDVSADGMAAVLRDGIAKGSPVKIFTSYHQSRKALDTWYIEPDGSLDEPPGGAAMEVVSPPLPVAQAIPVLRQFVATAKELGLETDDSTGLHINVSIPDKIDILKLIVFSGDEHVLQQFNREESEYAMSVWEELKDQADNPYGEVTVKNDDRIMKWLETVARDVTEEHTASISRNRKYISFRHAGDDYLNSLEGTVNVVGRFVRAMVIAATPSAYRNEYLKRVAALMEPARDVRRTAAGQRAVAPSSPALLWAQRNGWPALTVFAGDGYQARGFAQEVAPALIKLANSDFVQIPPAPEDLTLPRDVKKWAVIPRDLESADALMRSAPQIAKDRMTQLTTIPITKGKGREIYQNALRTAQRMLEK